MGLLYTKFYMDFAPDEWRQRSSDPPIFEALSDATLYIEDSSHKNHRLSLKKGARLEVRRVVGRYRITWDDAG